MLSLSRRSEVTKSPLKFHAKQSRNGSPNLISKTGAGKLDGKIYAQWRSSDGTAQNDRFKQHNSKMTEKG